MKTHRAFVVCIESLGKTISRLLLSISNIIVFKAQLDLVTEYRRNGCFRFLIQVATGFHYVNSSGILLLIAFN